MKSCTKLLFIYLIVILISCQNQQKKSDKPYILTTTGMLADAVFQLMGESAEVEALMGPGIDPHYYKASQNDLLKMQQADIIIANGLYLEGKLQDILKKYARQKPVYFFGDKINSENILYTEDNQIPDPHIWFDLTIWKQGLEHLSQKLSDVFPRLKDSIYANEKKYGKKLLEKHQELQQKVEALPKDKRILVTSHDAFHYFGRAYGFNVHALQGISTASEAGLRDRIELVNLIILNKISAIFVETTINSKSMEALIEDCKQKGHIVSIGGELFSDAMGEKGSPEGNVIGMISHNVETILKELRKNEP